HRSEPTTGREREERVGGVGAWNGLLLHDDRAAGAPGVRECAGQRLARRELDVRRRAAVVADHRALPAGRDVLLDAVTRARIELGEGDRLAVAQRESVAEGARERERLR